MIKESSNRLPGALHPPCWELPSPNLPLQVLPPHLCHRPGNSLLLQLMEISGSLVSLIFISSLLLLDEFGSLGSSGMESRRRRLLGKEDSCSGMEQPENVATVGEGN